MSVLAGIALVHAGDGPSRRYASNLIREARATLIALWSGQRLRAALLDFSGNLFLDAVPSTVLGMAVVPAFPYAAWRDGLAVSCR